jgi:hypothetical protein
VQLVLGSVKACAQTVVDYKPESEERLAVQTEESGIDFDTMELQGYWVYKADVVVAYRTLLDTIHLVSALDLDLFGFHKGSYVLALADSHSGLERTAHHPHCQNLTIAEDQGPNSAPVVLLHIAPAVRSHIGRSGEKTFSRL